MSVAATPLRMLPGMNLPRFAGPVAAFLLAASAATAMSSAFAAGQTVTLHSAGKAVRIVAGEAATLPPDFPADIALPPSLALLQVESTADTTAVEGTAPGDIEAMAADLRARMQAEGWRAAGVARPAEGKAMAWEKDARAVTAWLRPGDAGMDAGSVRVQVKLLPRR